MFWPYSGVAVSRANSHNSHLINVIYLGFTQIWEKEKKKKRTIVSSLEL
jgi:hypothetical protein